MEQWEHMAVNAIERPGDRGQLSTVDPDGFERIIDSDEANFQRTMLFLNELGRGGWQLVSTEHFAKTNEFLRIYWLKRQVRKLSEVRDPVTS